MQESVGAWEECSAAAARTEGSNKQVSTKVCCDRTLNSRVCCTCDLTSSSRPASACVKTPSVYSHLIIRLPVYSPNLHLRVCCTRNLRLLCSSIYPCLTLIRLLIFHAPFYSPILNSRVCCTHDLRLLCSSVYSCLTLICLLIFHAPVYSHLTSPNPLAT